MNIRGTQRLESPPLGTWYLVLCKSRQDHRAEENLVRQGYVCTRPVCSRDRIVRGRLVSAQESLFPGYLFINLSANANWSSVRSTRGVIRLVSFGGMPLPVHEDLIAQLQARVNQSSIEQHRNSEKVKIFEEGLANFEEFILNMDGDERAALLIDFLNRQRGLNPTLAKISGL